VFPFVVLMIVELKPARLTGRSYRSFDHDAHSLLLLQTGRPYGTLATITQLHLVRYLPHDSHPLR